MYTSVGDTDVFVRQKTRVTIDCIVAWNATADLAVTHCSDFSFRSLCDTVGAVLVVLFIRAYLRVGSCTAVECTRDADSLSSSTTNLLWPLVLAYCHSYVSYFKAKINN